MRRPTAASARGRKSRLLGLGLGVVLLAGCGSSGGGDSVLQRDAAGLADAARAGDPVAVQAALAQLRKDVAAEQAAGTVTADRAHQVLAAAAAVAADVSLPTPGVTFSPTPSPAAPKPTATVQRKGKGKGDGDHKD